MNFEKGYGEVWKWFILANLTYLASWSTVLCHIASGIISHPKEMPMAVWISTIGLLTLYQTFVCAQCNVILTRFRHIKRVTGLANATYSCMSFGDGKGVVLVAMSISFDLIRAVLFSVRTFRDFFEIGREVSSSEPWCVFAFLFLSSATTLAGARLFRETRHFIISYVVWITGCFFFWGFVVLPNLDDSQQTAWTILALALPVLVTAYAIYARNETTVPFASNLLDSEALALFANDHLLAAYCHVAMIFVIGILLWLKDIDFNSSFDTYSFVTDHTTFAYCARRNSLPVQRWWCAIGWCLASATNHVIAWSKINGAAQWLSYKVQTAFLLLGSTGVAIAMRDRAGAIGQVGLLLVLFLLGTAITFVLLGEGQEMTDTLRQIAHMKWVEYSVSAVLMHVVVNCIGGVINCHELVLLCGYLALSMVLVRLIEDIIDQVETTEGTSLTIQHRILIERPFVALSFFAKLTLTTALCLPLAFEPENPHWIPEPEWCP